MGRDYEKETRRIDRYLLVVIRTHTSMDRVFELLEVVGEGVSLAIKFVLDVGSKFAREVTTKLRALGAEQIEWEEAKQLYWDGIFAAHVDQQLAELCELSGNLFVVPHGVGYNRKRLISTGGRPGAAGLSAYELTHAGEVFPALIGISCSEQSTRLCPEARGREIVIGDLVRDKLIANRQHRRRCRRLLGIGKRKLIVVSSTWGQRSTFRTQKKIITSLVADLPSDEYAVALIMHPNIWYGDSPFELRVELRDELDSGLLIIDHTRWQAALLAADLVVGDHGSCTAYAVAMDLPVLIAACGSAELDEESPLAALHAELPRLGKTSLRERVDDALRGHVPGRWKHHTDRLFELPGEGLKAAANALRGLMDLPPLTGRPRGTEVEPPEAIRGKPTRSHRAVVTTKPDGTEHLERYPEILLQETDFPDSVRVVSELEVDATARDNAEIIVYSEVLPDDEAMPEIAEQLGLSKAGLAAAMTESGRVLLHFRDDQVVTARGDPFVVAVVLHWRRTHGTPLACGEFGVVMGNETYPVVVESIN
ncbi:hypothetical protein C8D88_12146 [Lentzea atacamensis]|uniref:UDP-N-acetylglucosamine 2-epimerase domain-containing protein n=2 Tax=Lentzea TaxID=165301 RepID=A0A316HL18_9PSEU|nr:hypothetical protein C8D88_12146 [Lentzea atacamensis]